MCIDQNKKLKIAEIICEGLNLESILKEIFVREWTTNSVKFYVEKCRIDEICIKYKSDTHN